MNGIHLFSVSLSAPIPVHLPNLLQPELALLAPADPESGELHITLDGQRIPYALRRSRRRRSIALLIDERGLHVAAPIRATPSAITAVLREHTAWIIRKVAEWRANKPPSCRWEAGGRILYLGMPLTLAAHEATTAPLRDSNLLYYGPQALTAAEIESRVRDWLKQQALSCYTGHCRRYSAQLGLAAPAVRLSNARTRWGSCHANGRISMNWRLIQTPPAWIEYVAAHEVAHLRQMNHSPAFWRTVAELVADHAERRAALRREAHRYLLL